MQKAPQQTTTEAKKQDPILIDPTQLTDMIAKATAAALAQMGVRPQLAPTVFIGGERSAQAQGISWRDFYLDEDLAETIPRSYMRGHGSETSFNQDNRYLRQMEREGVQIWPPNTETMWEWAKRHPRGRQSIDDHRKAWNRVLDYHGLPIPPQFAKKWATKRAVGKAVREGRKRRRIRHFVNGPWDVLKLTHASPFSLGPTAELMNLQFRHVATLMALGAPRSSEPYYLELENFRPERQEIQHWWQEKDDEERASVTIPETWFWTGVGMSYTKFVTDVRPMLASVGAKPSNAYILNKNGVPYGKPINFRNNFMAKGIRDALGYPIGPHAFRRFCATMRYAFYWSLDDVASFLHDDPATVRRHYIDMTLVDLVRKKIPRPNEDRPALPPFWLMPKICGLPKPGEAKITSDLPPIEEDE